MTHSPSIAEITGETAEEFWGPSGNWMVHELNFFRGQLKSNREALVVAEAWGDEAIEIIEGRIARCQICISIYADAIRGRL